MDLPALFSRFPLYTNTAVPVPKRFLDAQPTLWVAPPRDTDVLLSTDVECLKWQAYLALRGITHIALRWDISPEGALDARLPNLHLPDSSPSLLPPRGIPGWVDTRLGQTPDPLDGYRDQTAKDESHAWIALLEGVVHVALSVSQPDSNFGILFQSDSRKARTLDTVLNPPPAPSTGFTSPFPPFGVNVDASAVQTRYVEAIAALSDRLAADKWFLDSQQPTALDALLFAYLHTLLHNSNDSIRIQVARRPNLVAWERTVRTQVQAAFCLVSTAS